MATFTIRSAEHAAAIEAAWNGCGHCDRCPLNTPEGWRCSYLHEQAARYLNRAAQRSAKERAKGER